MKRRLEEWFANEVELDPTPGGRGVFRWDNGETREAVVESVEEGSRIVLRFEDDGIVDLRVVPLRQRHPRPGARDGTVLVDGARAPGAGCRARSGRRRLLRSRRPEPPLRRRDARVTRHRDARPSSPPTPRHPPGRGEAPAAAPRGRARRGTARGAGGALCPDAGAAGLGDRVDRARSARPGTNGSRRSSALVEGQREPGPRRSRSTRASRSSAPGPCRRSRPSGTRGAGRPSSRGTRRDRSSPSRGAPARRSRVARCLLSRRSASSYAWSVSRACSLSRIRFVSSDSA